MFNYKEAIHLYFPHDYEAFEQNFLLSLLPLESKKVESLFSALLLNHYHYCCIEMHSDKISFLKNTIDFCCDNNFHCNDILVDSIEKKPLLQVIYDLHCNYLDVIKHLIDKGYDIDDKNQNNETLLIRTLYNKEDEDFSLYLLEKGANPLLMDIWQDSALKVSVEKRKEKVFDFICSNNKEYLESLSDIESRKIAFALLYHDHISWYEKVLKNIPGFNININIESEPNYRVRTLLLENIKRGNFDICNLLLDNDIDVVNEPAFQGVSSLYQCFTCIYDSDDINKNSAYQNLARKIISKGADPYLILEEGTQETAFDYVDDPEIYIAEHALYQKNVLKNKILNKQNVKTKNRL